MKTFLVTGGAGFIGSNFIIHLMKQQPDCRIINIDKLTYAANLNNLSEIESLPNYHFVEGDICNRGLIEELFNKFDVCGVFHFAAESHVDNSISGPEVFIKSNIEGTFIVLDVARKSWMIAPGQYRQGCEECRFLYVSTDEVYGSLGSSGSFTEKTPFNPHSPYSASKAAADLLVRSYHDTYDMNVVVTNCSNNYGPRQHRENLIPLIIERALSGKPIPIYGDGHYIRDWLYVLDHCKAIDLVFRKGRAGESYNVGGKNEKENLWIVNTICNFLEKIKPSEIIGIRNYIDLIEFVQDRPGHDRRYAIDATKLEQNLGWNAEMNIEEGLEETVKWYVRQWDKGEYPGKS